MKEAALEPRHGEGGAGATATSNSAWAAAFEYHCHALCACRVSLRSPGGIVELGHKGEYMFEARRRRRAGLEHDKKQGA